MNPKIRNLLLILLGLLILVIAIRAIIRSNKISADIENQADQLENSR